MEIRIGYKTKSKLRLVAANQKKNNNHAMNLKLTNHKYVSLFG